LILGCLIIGACTIFIGFVVVGVGFIGGVGLAGGIGLVSLSFIIGGCICGVFFGRVISSVFLRCIRCSVCLIVILIVSCFICSFISSVGVFCIGFLFFGFLFIGFLRSIDRFPFIFFSWKIFSNDISRYFPIK